MFAVPNGHAGSLLIGRLGHIKAEAQKATGEKNKGNTHMHKQLKYTHSIVLPSILSMGLH